LLGQGRPMQLTDKYQKELMATLEDSFNINMQLSGSLAEAMGIPVSSTLTAAAKRNAVATALSEASYLNDPIGKLAAAAANVGAYANTFMLPTDSGGLGVEYQYSVAKQMFPEWVHGIEEKARISLNNSERKAALQQYKDQEARASAAIADPSRSFKRQNELRSYNFYYDQLRPRREPLMSEYVPFWQFAQ